MRSTTMYWRVVCLGTAVGISSGAGFGCSRMAEDCENILCSMPTGSGGNGGGGGGGIPGCEASPIDTPDVIKDECGVFVRSDAAVSGDGTKDEPYQSIGEAIAALPMGKRLYICGGQSFAETVVLPGGVEVFGGLKCADESWTYQGGVAAEQTVIAPAAAGAAPITVEAGSGKAQVYGVHAMALAGVEPGQSSIAVIVATGGAAEFHDCTLTAGNGADGAEGTTPGGTGTPGETGNDGNEGCSSAATVVGGDPKTSMCAVDESTTGGPGGSGTVDVGGDGSNGSATPAPPTPADNRGVGQPNGGVCTTGGTGVMGINGTPGTGGTGLGAISSAGYLGVAGMSGTTAGKPGQGGGGGGGARGASQCNPATNAGASGGSGGTGGCGGAIGNGGGPGGSSLGLLSISATVSLKNVRITLGNGGIGGAGSSGQPGGSGGQPGSAGGDGACPGGIGGQGGRGGAAGGGVGGHAIGVAFTGTAPDQAEVTITKGLSGVGGPGGDGGMMNQGLAGADGVSMERQSFD